MKTHLPHPAPPDAHSGRPGRAVRADWRAPALLVLGLLLVYPLRFVLLPFVAAGALAFLTTPLVDRLHARLRGPRAVAVLCVYLVLLGSLGTAGYLLATALVREAAELAQAGPGVVRSLVVQVLGGERATVWGRTVEAEALTQSLLAGAGNFIESTELGRWAAAGIQTAAGVVLMLVLLYYFLLDGRRLLDGLHRLVPPECRPFAQAVAARIQPMLGDYFRSVAVVVTAASLISWIGLGWILRLPHAGPLALATGLLELIPVVGQVTAAALLGSVALLQGDVWLLAGVAAFLVVLRLSIDQIVGPLVLGRGVRLHPVVVLFSILSGAVLFGVLGLLLAVPTAAAVKIVLEEMYGEA